jgi:hypothetical protein
MSVNSIEICVKGKYFTVPALPVNGKNIISTGRFVRVAIVHAEDWMETELEDPETCIKRLKDSPSQDLKADIFTFTQRLPALEPKYSYPVEWDSVAAISLTSFTDWWDNLPQETRRNTRIAEKRGVITKVHDFDDDLIRGIVEINNDSLMRQGKIFDHFGKTFIDVKKDQLSFVDRSAFICAYSGLEMIGFMKIVFCGKIGRVLQFLPKISSHDKKPANALMSKAVEHCLHKGMTHLVYERYAYGRKRNSSLTAFKKRNGFQEILVPRFYVPLTVNGKIAISLRIHHGLVELLPEWAISLAGNLRKKLNRFTLSLSWGHSMAERSKHFPKVD